MKRFRHQCGRVNAGAIALIYFVLGTLWILLSDTLVAKWMETPESQALAQNFKGILYVLVTTALVYGLARWAIQSVERKQREIRALTDNAPDVIWSVNLDCVVRYVNPAVAALTGYTPSQVIGTPIRTYCTEKSYLQLEELLERFRGSSDTDSSPAFESEVTHRNGEVIPVEVRCQCLRAPDGAAIGLQGISRDLRERRAMEAHLRQAQKMESIGTLSSGVAHEVNNPIGVISGLAECLMLQTDISTDQRESLEKIREQTQHIHRIVHNLLGYARADGRPKAEKFPPDEPLTKSLDLSSVSLRHDFIKVETDIASDLPRLTGYPFQIQQVLLNLLHNARDALNERYPQAHDDKILRLFIRQPDPTHIRYTVEDHGNGLDTERRERLFEPFFTTKPEGEGTGLGLWIAHGVVQRHRGRIEVESAPGTPTRFHVDLPVDCPPTQIR